MKLFGTSGIRTVADRGLLQLALKVGMAVGNIYSRVVVGSDTRTSNDAVKYALISGLLAAGAEAYDGGVMPTPTLALAAREFTAGVMITASHNPPQYNGLKLLNPDGSSFDSPQQQQIEELISSDALACAPWDKMAGYCVYSGAVTKHIERIREDFPERLKFKAVVDCGCAAASLVTPELLGRLGGEVISLNCTPSGCFPHPIEPIEANLGELMQATKDSGADIGIAHDGDADRMMAIDERGRFIPGDKLLAILAQEAEGGRVVTTIDASMAIDEMGFEVVRTRIGDTWVSTELKRGGRFGGEPSGSWIFPAISLCPDGIYAAAKLAAIASRQKISELVDRIPAYPVIRGATSSEGVVMAQLKQRLIALEPVSVSSFDGLNLSFADGQLLVRASGTEPKIRVRAEAKNKARARQLYEAGIEAIKECSKGRRVEVS
ncbi:phosphoglucosamine mutase [Chloroflexota bacterium]